MPQVFLPGLLVFAAGLAVALITLSDESAFWLVALLVSEIIAAALLWHRLPWSDTWSRYLGFGAIVLLACIVNRLLYVGDLLIAGDSRFAWPFYADSIAVSTLKAEVATFAGILLTTWAWVRGGGLRYSPGDALGVPAAALRPLMIATYLSSVAGLALALFAPVLLRATGQLLPILLGLGTASAFLLPVLLSQHRFVRIVLACALSLPFLYAALGTGMKENILLAMAPAAFYLWQLSRGGASRGLLVLVGVLAVGLITSYIQFYRGEAWHADRDIDQSQAMVEFAQSIESQGASATVLEGALDFLERNNASAYRGWAVEIADAEGYRPGLVFAPMAYVFVPRILWPGKPDVRQGWEYSGLVFGADYVSWSDSSLSAGLYPGLYMGMGWIAVAAGALLLGLMMAFATQLSAAIGGRVLSSMFALCMVPYALRLDELWTVGAFSAPLISLVYVSVLFFGVRVVSGIRLRARGELP